MSGTVTTIPFNTVHGQVFTFQVVSLGATAAINTTGTQFTVNILWSTFGQRWIVEVVDQNGQRILTKPLIGSPQSYPINMLGGYFTSKLVYSTLPTRSRSRRETRTKRLFMTEILLRVFSHIKQAGESSRVSTPRSRNDRCQSENDPRGNAALVPDGDTRPEISTSPCYKLAVNPTLSSEGTELLRDLDAGTIAGIMPARSPETASAIPAAR